MAVWPAKSKVEPDDGAYRIDIPETFSFIENVPQTLGVLHALRAAAHTPEVEYIYFNHGSCRRLDLCASVVTDVLVLRAKLDRRLRGGRLTVGGAFSGSPDVNVMLKASGILKHLGLAKAALPEDVRDRLRCCELFEGKESPPEKTSDSEIAATELTKFFDSCLSTERYHLRHDWQRNLISLITEVLDNCEEHARRDHRWYTIGHFNRLADETGGKCHIVVLNFGDSIYESLQRPETPQPLKDRISELAAVHRSKGFFLLRPRQKWEEETLWTLYALQEGVSRFSYGPGGVDRGNGTVRMIEFFSELAGERPQMSLVSGRTHILFDGTYTMKPTLLPSGEERKLVAFNVENDLRVPPDERYVQSLPMAFPGTLVSLRFLLRGEYLKQVTKVVYESH